MSKSTSSSASTSIAKAQDSAVTRAKPGILSRFAAALSRSRQMQAEREVQRYLARQSDPVLHDIGLTDAEIAELRAKHGR